MGDGSGTHARLVGEYPPAATHLQSRKSRTQGSAGDSPGTKSPGENCLKSPDDPPTEHQEHNGTHQEIPCRGKRHQKLGGFSHPAGSAPQEHPHGQRHANAQQEIAQYARATAKAGQNPVAACDHRVDLGGVAHPEGGENTK